MTDLLREVVYLGGDNVNYLVLKEDGTAINHTLITRMILEFGARSDLLSASPYLTIDSDIDSSYFDFTASANVKLILGQASIPRGRHIVRPKVYGSAWPNGVYWEPWLLLDVK